MDENIMYCEIYEKNLNNMIIRKNDAPNDMEKLKILIEFGQMFTMLPEQQSELLRLSRRCNFNLPKDLSNCLYSIDYGDKNFKHIKWSNHREVINKLNDVVLRDKFKLTEEALSFPHRWFPQVLDACSDYFVKPIDGILAKNLKLYCEIFESKNVIDKWLKCIKKIENKEAVIANLELKLGQNNNWKNKKLWKFYFDFLKENNMTDILEVFRKYTRLFIYDKQAVEDYRNEIEKYSTLDQPQLKYWIDTIQYEMDFGTLELAYRILERVLKAVIGKEYHFVVKDENDLCSKLKTFKKEVMKHEKLHQSSEILKYEKTFSSKPTVYFQNPKRQFLCFRQSFIQNLLKNAKWFVLRKLYSTCKFFYSVTTAPLCYRFEVSSNHKTSYCLESLFINEKDVHFIGIQNLHVYDTFVVYNSTGRNIIPDILPKLKICDALHICVRNQDFTISEFRLLLSKNISVIEFRDVNIQKDNNETITAAEAFKIFKDYPLLRSLVFLNHSFLIIDYFVRIDLLKPLILHLQNFHLETIYISKQIVSFLDLQLLIDFQHLKDITLKQVIVLNDGDEISKQVLEEFITANVNPANNVYVKIL